MTYSQASTTFIYDGTTPTKQLTFALSSATASTKLTLAGQQTTSQTLNIPNITSSDTLVTLALAQTLTNKTLTTPIISTITNTGTLTLPTTTDTLVGRSTTDFLKNKSFAIGSTSYTTGTASQTTTTVTGVGTTFLATMVGGLIVYANAVQAFITAFGSTTSLTTSQSQTVASQAYTIYYNGLQVDNIGNTNFDGLLYMDAANTYIQDTTTPTKQITYSASAASASTILTLASTQSTTQTLNFPNITGADTLASLALAQTLTNKTITDNSSNIISRGLWVGSGASSLSSYAAPAPTAGQYLYAATSTTLAFQTLTVVYTYLTSTTTATTTSSTYVTLTSMTATPVAGTYKVSFSGVFETTASNIYITICKNGVSIADSVRYLSGAGVGTIYLEIHTQTVVTANGTDVIDIRWNNNADAGTVTCTNRNCILLKIG
jgi:hypothetical protein